MTDKTDRLQNVAQAILALTYSEMMEIARCLQDMNENLPRHFSSPDEWAEILHTWAEMYDEARHEH